MIDNSQTNENFIYLRNFKFILPEMENFRKITLVVIKDVWESWGYQLDAMPVNYTCQTKDGCLSQRNREEEEIDQLLVGRLNQ